MNQENFLIETGRKNILYPAHKENGKEYKAVLVPKQLTVTLQKEIYDRFSHCGIDKIYHQIKR